MSKKNPNDTGVQGAIFGHHVEAEDAEVILMPIPWEVTVSGRDGTAAAPQAILQQSCQVDLYHPKYPNAWELGIHMLPIPEKWQNFGEKMRQQVAPYQRALEEGSEKAHEHIDLNLINSKTAELKVALRERLREYLIDEKIVGLVGGDHSLTLSMIHALVPLHSNFGILQIDAHADLRKNYQGLHDSHASVMRNVLKYDHVYNLVQVGVRDYCPEEADFMESQNGRIATFTDQKIQDAFFKGGNWYQICNQIINCLPRKVYVSFDIDGLDPSLAPHTGTPVPGGLSFAQATYLLQTVVESGREIIGFDLCEVGNHEWDALVGARMLYQLCVYTAASRDQL